VTERPGDQREGAEDVLAMVTDHERWLASSSEGRRLEPVGASFGSVDLSGRDLSDAWLSDCDLTGVRLRGAWLLGTRLLGCRLDGADLSRARMDRCDASESQARRCTLTGADLTRAEFQKADLAGADLSRTFMCKTKLDGADLTGAVLREADLDRTSVDGVRLVGADVTGVVGTVVPGPTFLTDGDEAADPAALVEWLRQSGSGPVELFDLARFSRGVWRWPLPNERPPFTRYAAADPAAL
jgi:hypothetical protein